MLDSQLMYRKCNVSIEEHIQTTRFIFSAGENHLILTRAKFFLQIVEGFKQLLFSRNQVILVEAGVRACSMRLDSLDRTLRTLRTASPGVAY